MKDFQANKIKDSKLIPSASWPFPPEVKDKKDPWPWPRGDYVSSFIPDISNHSCFDPSQEDTFICGTGHDGYVGGIVSTIGYVPNKVLEKDPNGKSLNDVGAKADAGKNRVWLCLAGFSNALEEVAKVTTEGAKKYTPNGWVSVPDAENRYMDAFGRHLLKLGKGEIYDTEPNGIGTKHIAQMIWNLLAVLELQERNERS